MLAYHLTLYAVAVALLTLFVSAENSETIVLPDGSQLRGKIVGDVAVFKGIRFAAPPVGSLRWAPPAPWTNPKDEVVDATEFGNVCKQFNNEGIETGDEDCLFLNVYVNLNVSRADANHPLPVGFFIHGGSYMNGAGSIYNGTDFVHYWKGSKVLVTTNYRLNVFGFSGSELLRRQDSARGSTGNYGLQDQRAAMEWVQTNIGAFGGDAGKVMIYGESAGAGSISNHLVMPQSWGLFHSAVLESGSFAEWVTQYMGIAQGAFDRLAAQLGCDTGDDEVSCMLERSMDDVFGASLDAVSMDAAYGTPYNPTADGVELVTHPWISLVDGKIADVPVLHGSNTDEGSMFVGLPTTLTEQELIAYWRSFNYSTYGLSRLTDLYVTNKTYPIVPMEVGQEQPTVYWWAAMRSLGDIAFSCPNRATSTELSRLEVEGIRKSRSFLYHFEYLANSSTVPYVQHTAELRFVFHWAGYLQTPSDIAMGDAISGYWGNFLEAGDPNGMAPTGFSSLPAWTPYDAASDLCLVMPQAGPDAFGMQGGLKKDECAFESPRTDASIRRNFAA